jgi:hypothetical protein
LGKKFSDHVVFGPDINLDKELVLDYDGTRLTEAKVEEIATRNSELRSAQTKNN